MRGCGRGATMLHDTVQIHSKVSHSRGGITTVVQFGQSSQGRALRAHASYAGTGATASKMTPLWSSGSNVNPDATNGHDVGIFMAIGCALRPEGLRPRLPW